MGPIGGRTSMALCTRSPGSLAAQVATNTWRCRGHSSSVELGGYLSACVSSQRLYTFIHHKGSKRKSKTNTKAATMLWPCGSLCSEVYKVCHTDVKISQSSVWSSWSECGTESLGEVCCLWLLWLVMYVMHHFHQWTIKPVRHWT